MDPLSLGVWTLFSVIYLLLLLCFKVANRDNNYYSVCWGIQDFKNMQLYSDNMVSDHMTVLMEEDDISFCIVGKFVKC